MTIPKITQHYQQKLWSINCQKNCQANSLGKKTVFVTNGAVRTGYPYGKEEC